jgi:hypothetical protein
LINKNIIDQWVTALESKKYKKGKYFLRQTLEDEDRWSVSGVFCDIFKTLKKAEWIKSPHHTETIYFMLGMIDRIPLVLLEKLKINPKDIVKINKVFKEYEESSDFKKEITYLKTLIQNGDT